MKASKFTDAQKAFILKQGADGHPVAEICRKAGISEATYFNWKKKYEGLLPDEMRRLKQLEDENSKLKKWWLTCLSTKRCCRMSYADPKGSAAKTVRPARASWGPRCAGNGKC